MVEGRRSSTGSLRRIPRHLCAGSPRSIQWLRVPQPISLPSHTHASFKSLRARQHRVALNQLLLLRHIEAGLGEWILAVASTCPGLATFGAAAGSLPNEDLALVLLDPIAHESLSIAIARLGVD